MMLFARAVGVPGAQGSKAFKGMRFSKRTGRNHAVMVESSKKVAPWREAVAAAVSSANGAGLYFDGAVRLTVTFVMPRTGAEPKGWTRHHTRAPDLDKLVRSTCDAIKTAGAWKDDSLVVELVAQKVTAEPGEAAGAQIIIEALQAKEKPHVEKKERSGNRGGRGRRGGGSGASAGLAL